MSCTPNRLHSKFENHPTLPIAIVGGGLGGLALAIGLIKRGINVRVFESGPAFSEIGAGVAFGLNSMTALQLIDPKLFEGYMKHATFNADRGRDSTFVSFRWGMDETTKGGHLAGDFMWHLDDKWCPERAKALGVKTRSCIHRARLLEELVALLPPDVTSFGKTFEGSEEQDDGTLRLCFADGTTTLASAVIGCDGIKSKVRDSIHGTTVQPTNARECVYRAMAPQADLAAALGPELTTNGQLYCGYGGYIITYPVENGDLVNMVAVSRDPHEDSPCAPREWTAPATTEGFMHTFGSYYAPLIGVFSRYLSPTKWALCTLRHDAPYFKGRTCLLGDSAHATTPHLGAGAGMAMEDAYMLSNLVASVGGVADIENAFTAYDSVRRPRTQKCIKKSFEAVLGYTFQLPGVEDDTASLKHEIEECFRWLWHEDLEAQLQAAKELL